MGLSAAKLTCDDCGKRVVSGWDSSEDTASGLAREARRENGWEKIGQAWLCQACAAKFRRAEEASAAPGERMAAKGGR